VDAAHLATAAECQKRDPPGGLKPQTIPRIFNRDFLLRILFLFLRTLYVYNNIPLPAEDEKLLLFSWMFYLSLLRNYPWKPLVSKHLLSLCRSGSSDMSGLPVRRMLPRFC
jgi:hypothetical protein